MVGHGFEPWSNGNEVILWAQTISPVSAQCSFAFLSDGIFDHPIQSVVKFLQCIFTIMAIIFPLEL